MIRAVVFDLDETLVVDPRAGRGVRDPDLATELGERFDRERRARHETFADAEPVLAELGARHRLALLTNGAACLQREKLAASGLERHFDAAVVSADLGAGKPAPEAFAAALDPLGVQPVEAVMVGDSLDRDVPAPSTAASPRSGSTAPAARRRPAARGHPRSGPSPSSPPPSSDSSPGRPRRPRRRRG